MNNKMGELGRDGFGLDWIWTGKRDMMANVPKGPYAPSILRFRIAFPPAYPEQPPLLTFATDIFHPLVSPLTTYMYTGESAAAAQEGEPLPPGGFSLRAAGFPGWFGKGEGTRGEVCIYDVLRYVRSAFDEEAVLDRVPLSAAGNPGAWHAWRSYRAGKGVVLPLDDEMEGDEGEEEAEGSADVPEGYRRLAGGTSAPVGGKRPGEWNWDGVWEVRVKKGMEGSIAEGTLFGREAGDDLIRFLKLDPEQCEALKESIKKSVESVEPLRREIV